MKTDQGRHMREKGEKTRERVRQWVKDNPTKIKADAIRELGITRLTLNKHLDALEKENRQYTNQSVV